MTERAPRRRRGEADGLERHPFPTEVVWECGRDDLGGYLYEFFREDGKHLYIGVTRSPVRRFRQHAQYSIWYPLVHHAAIRALDDWRRAHRLEDQLIAERRPLHNVPRSDAGRRSWETRRGLKPPARIERGQNWGDAPLCRPVNRWCPK